MNCKRPLILISNDDGYNANGIKTLASFLSDFAEVLICAPEGPRSGFSCAFSASDSLRLNRRNNIPNCEVWSCTGTPVDCVKIAFEQILNGRRPDLILGGINHGDNSSVNTHYSGTMGIAREGCLKYVPSVAFSSCDYNPDANLEHLRSYVVKIVKQVLSDGMPNGQYRLPKAHRCDICPASNNSQNPLDVRSEEFLLSSYRTPFDRL